MKLVIPVPALILMLGASGSGKSTFARAHFRPTEILSSDFFRALVSDDETNQGATQAAFEVLHLVAARRMAAGRVTVVDATNLRPWARRPLLALAEEHHVQAAAIVLDLPAETCIEHDRQRPDRQVGADVIRAHVALLHRALQAVQHEGFQRIFVLHSPEEVRTAAVERCPRWR